MVNELEEAVGSVSISYTSDDNWVNVTKNQITSIPYGTMVKMKTNMVDYVFGHYSCEEESVNFEVEEDWGEIEYYYMYMPSTDITVKVNWNYF